MGESGLLTPMFRQYRALKQENADAILLFRMGDFYEMFFEDAREASGLLELTLTARGKGTDHVVPMCGFPHHQLDAYTARLVRAGRKVAVCEQMEDPRRAKGLVRREVVRIVTPGTLTDPGQLDSKAHAWLASVAAVSRAIGAAFVDASTGEFLAWQSNADEDPWEALAQRFSAFAPREIVHPDEFPWTESFRRERTAGAMLTPGDPFAFDPAESSRLLQDHLSVASLDGFGLGDRPAAVAAAGGLLHYVRDTQKCALEHIDALACHEPSRFVLFDDATRRNLELERSLRDGGRGGSLVHALDATVTAPGARLLREWLLAPLRETEAISERLDAVEELVARPDLRGQVRERLRGVHDVGRLLGRAVTGAANARDLLALRGSLERLPALVETLGDARSPLVRRTADGFDVCSDLTGLLARGVAEDPPVSLREGGLIRAGYDADLDELRSIRRDGKTYLSSLEAREREATGIGNLKVKYNKVFGYFIEVSKSNLHLVPGRYERRQTLASGERYVTPEIKEYESRVLNAQERIEELEFELFAGLRKAVVAEASRLKAAARVVALFDVLACQAETAAVHDYRRPVVHPGARLRIRGGRHPVVERAADDDPFVPNDTSLDGEGEAIAILTGPNMGGKSTYLRQVALITLMAQCGCFVPAEEAEIGVVDRIFCRVGASDSLAEGQSTFMVEMTETAHILRHATARSLVLLDEVGRGTSTFDGLSIAWAVVEHLASRSSGTPRTLFATHYHELTELVVELDGIQNLRMAVREWGDEVVFLHRVEPGAADRSYGIQVARLAGVPQPVIHRAREILSNLERDEFGRDGLPRRARGEKGPPPERRRAQLPLFGHAEPEPVASRVVSELREVDPERLTPLEALRLVDAWRKRLLE